MKDIRLLVASLLIACLVWVMHTFTLEYSATVPCTVHVVSNIRGYAPEAVAKETLLLRGKATGFYLLKARGTGRRPMDLTISVEAHHFRPAEGEEDHFVLPVSDIREKLNEQLGDRFDVDFIETEQLSFAFTPQSYVKVPVEASLDLSFRPQYMQVGQVQLKPDSVLVYGPVKDIQRITQVRTRSISRTLLDKSLQGYVSLEPIAGLRIDAEQVWYDVEVERYVESTMTLPVTASNLPSGATMVMLPSRVEITFRAPFHPRGGRIMADDLSLVVDYRDFAGAGSTRMIPQLVTQREIYSWRLRPELVECILMENR
ncbi:MAG: hypothetical protein IJL93_04080 [Bacteroidales bacterium]|nr:hypothetical protein [Bacteroidales bacterium]